MKWEFKTYRWNSANVVTYEDLEKDLNELGKIGWEVIDIAPAVFSGNEGITEQTNEVVYILKREKK